jgi:DNA-binding NarL/FixJ family response regulator
MNTKTNQTITKPIILIVEDNRYFIDKMKKAFQKDLDLSQNYELEIIGDTKRAQEYFDEHNEKIKLLYLDYMVPGNPLGTTAGLLEKIKSSSYTGPIIAISSFMNKQLMKLGCDAEIEKESAIEDASKRLKKSP